MSSLFIGKDGKPTTRVYVVGSESDFGGGSGMRFLHGTIDPTSEDGMPNDVYLNTESGDLFQNKNGTWSLLMNIKGADGKNGQDGSDGQDGFPTEAQWNDLVARVEALETSNESTE